MRASQFLVASDSVLLSAGGARVRVVLQSATGQIYVLDDELLRKIRRDPSTLPDSVIDELAAAGVVVDDNGDEFSTVVNENLRARDPHTRTFVLMPSAYCNMGCGYCGQQHVKSPQSQQHRQAVAQRILHAVRDPATTALNVNWFGAEPMMGYAQILDIAAAVIPTCRDHDVRYSSKMVTNGVLLTVEKIRRLHLQCLVGSFEITLDGPAATHDSQRPLRSGRRSFDRIVSTIQQACAEPDLPQLRFSIRTNVSRANQDTHDAFAATMREAGLADPKVRFYMALVREWGNDVSDYAVAPDRVIDIERQWLRAYLDNGLTTSVLPITRRHQVCTAVIPGAEVIAPNGDVHSCTEQPLVPGREHTTLGHVTDLQTPRRRPPGAYDTWNEDLLGDTTAYCPTCSIFPICGGSCPLVWHQGTPACPPLKSTLPMRLTMYGHHLGLIPA